jgi:SET domain-containing protein 6
MMVIQILSSSIVASNNINSGETLFTLPRAALLTHQTSNNLTAWTDATDLEDPWTSLLLALLLESARAAKGESGWQAYLDILPSQASQFNTLMFWTASELDQLQASSVRDKIGRAGAEAKFRALAPRIRENRDVFGFAAIPDSQLEEELVKRCHVLASLIMAYAFDVQQYPRSSQPDDDGYVTDEEDQDLPKAMVPLADLLNADGERNNARLFYEDDGTLVMRAVQDIGEGEEVFNDYGPLPRSELVRRYGYITDEYAKYDVVDVPMKLFLEISEDMFGTSDGQVLDDVSFYEIGGIE